MIGHSHVKNANQLANEHLTRGEQVADAAARTIGSWRFIGAQSFVLVTWIVLNGLGWLNAWDPYPFILLNLLLSFQAAYSAPVIMMSQNRQAAKDRLTADLDYHINLKAEIEVSEIHERLNELTGQQWQALLALQQEQVTLLNRIEALAKEMQPVGLSGATTSPSSPPESPRF
jgi:uncharacterized membrane protein